MRVYQEYARGEGKILNNADRVTSTFSEYTLRRLAKVLFVCPKIGNDPLHQIDMSITNWLNMKEFTILVYCTECLIKVFQ